MNINYYSISAQNDYCCCCCSHINSHNQVRGHRTGSSYSGAEEYPRKKARTNQRWYTHISQLTQFMPPPETYEREIGSQTTICQVHTGAYVSLLAPEKNNYTACHPRKTTTCILHVVPITTHTHDRRKSTHDRRKSIGKKKQKKEKKIKERKEKARKRKNKKGKEKKKRQEKIRQNKQEKTRQEEEARKGKEKKNGHTSRP